MAARIPNLTRGIDVFSLPLSTKEGFVLSRVDGVTSVEDISLMVGIKLSELLAMLDRLADLGAVQLSWRAEKPPKSEPEPAAVDSNKVATKAQTQAAVARALATPGHPLYMESELDAKADISVELKKMILNGYYGLEGKDYYQLLGCARNVDKKEIRGAYFELSKLFHPDSLFGKELGVFKPMMETVFKRFTEAYEVLGRNNRRKEYDDYLASTATTSAVQQQLDQVQIDVGAIEAQAAAAKPIEDDGFAAEWPREADTRDWPRDSEVRAPAVPREARESVETARVAGSQQRQSEPRAAAAARDKPQTLMPPPTPEARREAAVALRPPVSREDRKAQARERLRRNLPGAAGNLPSQPPAAPERSSNRVPAGPAHASNGANARAATGANAHGAAASGANAQAANGANAHAANAHAANAANANGGKAAERRDSAIKGLRQDLRRAGQSSGGSDAVIAHLRKAKDAEQAGDLLAAASALQAALTLEPNHKDLQAQYARVSKAVTRSLADNYEKQARYEEKQSKWAAAATSWERVAEGRPEDAVAARATADALIKARGDLHKAQRFAQHAVDAAPNDVDNVVVLARVLLAAGLRLNARRELEKAVKLDPQNEMIKNLLREAR